MKFSSWRYAALAGVGILTWQSLAGASVVILTGSLQMQAGTNTANDTVPLGTTTYIGNPNLHDQGNMAAVRYDLTTDHFILNNFSLARTESHTSYLSGSILFAVDAATDYDISGILKYAENDIPGLSSISTQLLMIGPSATLASYQNSNSTSDLGKLTLGTTEGDTSHLEGSLSGTLQPGNLYQWTYDIQLADQGTSNAPAVGTGDLQVIFTNDVGGPSTPEPATIGTLGLSGLGLLLRRRK